MAKDDAAAEGEAEIDEESKSSVSDESEEPVNVSKKKPQKKISVGRGKRRKVG